MATDKDIKSAVDHMNKENRQAKKQEEELPPALPIAEKPTMTEEEFRAYRLKLIRMKSIGF